MTIIDGTTQKRTVLIANTETIITFYSSKKTTLSIYADGGTVYYKINGTITDNNDLSANYIKDGQSNDIYKSTPIAELHVYTTATNVTLQWDIP